MSPMSKVEPHRTLPGSVLLLTALTMLAFAANSLLCRAALKQTGIDAGSFTTIRLASGALALGLVVRARGALGRAASGREGLGGNWPSALILFVYAAGFSFAYVRLPAAVGALILFGSVQATMIGYGLWAGERLRPAQVAGLVLALSGLVALLLPGLSAPPLGSAALMAIAGMAWGAYSLRGKGASDPAGATAGNFLRSLPFALALSGVLFTRVSLSAAGIGCALASGALASGLGYVIWYSVVPRLTATSAATVQLSVPVLAAAGGVLLLGEKMSLRLLLCSAVILGGIALVTLARRTLRSTAR
jgi:drug/metabolite transporter (DMT)-like permease